MPQWVDAKWTQCLCQVVRGKRGSLSLSLCVSLQRLPHRNIYSSVLEREGGRERDAGKKISAVDSELMLITGLVFGFF